MNSHLLDNKENWLNFIPEQTADNALVAWKEELSAEDKLFFDTMIRNLYLTGNYVTYLGKTKYIHHDIYTTILNEPTWQKWQKKQWTTYIMEVYGSISSFNERMRKQKEINIYSKVKGLSFTDEPSFNLLVSFKDKLNPKVYAKINEHNNAVLFLCSLNDADAKRSIFNYLKLNLSLSCLKGISSEQKVYDAFIDEVSRGYYRCDIEPVIISNDENQYCHTYIPLNYDASADTPNWDEFMSQIDGERAAHNFMAWIYGIFVAKDKDRRILWLMGEAKTGKTTIANAISNYLRSFNHDLVGTLAREQSKFSLNTVINARFVVYSEARDKYFFKRHDVLTLTGNDIVFYEEKFKNPVAKRFFAKILVTSNYPPMINTNNSHEHSRLLYIKLAKPNEKFKELNNNQDYIRKLEHELPFFLNKCKICYERKTKR